MMTLVATSRKLPKSRIDKPHQWDRLLLQILVFFHSSISSNMPLNCLVVAKVKLSFCLSVGPDSHVSGHQSKEMATNPPFGSRKDVYGSTILRRYLTYPFHGCALMRTELWITASYKECANCYRYRFLTLT
ncbi:unnamed protein product [Lactuca saligna]|uniref:Uncharacterized protein n=1 Tax=Lactuca saligna TaxID=75948 RepID=A0AA35YQB2_LACSI|nr:unnamed protein product [Lactuca saligna]